MRVGGGPTLLRGLTQRQLLVTVLQIGAPALNSPHYLTQILPAATGVDFCGPGRSHTGASSPAPGGQHLGRRCGRGTRRRRGRGTGRRRGRRRGAGRRAGAGGDGAQVREADGAQARDGHGAQVREGTGRRTGCRCGRRQGAGAGGDGAQAREGDGAQAREGTGLTLAVRPGPWLGGQGNVTVPVCLALSRPQAPSAGCALPAGPQPVSTDQTVLSH